MKKKATEPTKKAAKFQGVKPPHYTQIPDEIIDKLMPEISGAAFKVVMYICRRTFGFTKEKDNISLNQLVGGITTKDGTVLDRGTGLNKDTVVKAIKELEERNVIIVKRNLNKKGSFKSNTYSMNMIKIGLENEQNTDETDAKIQQGVVGKSDKGGSRKIRLGVVGKSDKGVVGKSDIQETVLQETVLQETVSTTTVTPNPNVEPSNEKVVVVACLIDFGVANNVAEKLASKHEPQYLRQKLDYAQYLLEHAPQKITSPKDWLVKAIEQDFAAPDGFIAQDDLAAQAAREELEAQRQTAQAQREAKKQKKIAQLEKEKYQQWRSALNQAYGTTEKDFELWKLALASLKTAFSGNQLTYKDVVAKAEILRVDEQNVWLGVDTKFALDRMNHRNHIVFEREFTYILQKPVKVEFVVVGTPDSVAEAEERELAGQVNGAH